MRDPIDSALRRIYFEIPKYVLYSAFISKHPTNVLDSIIVSEVIQNIVLHDVNTVGGKLAKIPLTIDNAVCLDVPNMTSALYSFQYTVYRVLPHARDNRPITAVHSLHYPYLWATHPYPYTPYMSFYPGRTAGLLASTALNANTHHDAVTAPTPILLAGDVVKLEPPQTMHIDWILECRIEYDENFSNMDVNLIPTFVELCLSATKYYIYNNLTIEIDQVPIMNGQELGVFKSIVDNYANELDRYKELLKQFASVSVLEPERLKKLVAYML